MDKKLITKAHETNEFETEETAVFTQTVFDTYNPACYIDPTKYHTNGDYVCTANDKRYQEASILPDGTQRHYLTRYTDGRGNYKYLHAKQITPEGNTITIYTGMKYHDYFTARNAASNLLNDLCSKVDNGVWINPQGYSISVRIAGNNWHIEVYM